jgi:hypothetical protein
VRVLLTCGIGDFIAMESFLSPSECASVTAIHWATRARAGIMPLVPFVFPNCTEHVIERDTFGGAFTADFCISSRAELPKLPADVVDWNVRWITDEIRAGARPYHGSRVVDQELASLQRLGLPPMYFVVHPRSDNARTLERDLNGAEWFATQQYAKRSGAPLVIVDKGAHKLPAQLTGVIDLSNKLTVLEAIEVTKCAAAFVGCASFPAIVAAKTLPRSRFFVKANHSVRRFFFWFYYAPHDVNDFVTDDLMKILPHD